VVNLWAIFPAVALRKFVSIQLPVVPEIFELELSLDQLSALAIFSEFGVAKLGDLLLEVFTD
jgi:hypothetical protein